MANLSQFQNKHKGEILLLVGNGINLRLTPPEKFDYPSIGVNEIHLYEGWKPTYYTCVDLHNYVQYGKKIATEFADIPKFIPAPRLSKWKGENFYHFKNFQGKLWPKNGKELWQDDFINEPVIYGNIMHVAIKLAYFMGASTILIIGMEHRPHTADRHFYGINLGMSADQYTGDWLRGYKLLCDKLAENGVKLINISEDTYVSSDIIPVDNWRKYIKE